MMKISKLVVLGHSGFLGMRFLQQVGEYFPSLNLVGFSTSEADLSTVEGAHRVEAALDDATAIVTFAGIKPQRGDGLAVLQTNLAIHVALGAMLERKTIARLLHVSSAAVYGEDVHNALINEATPLKARSFYGLAKISAEFILDSVCAKQNPPVAVTHFRPALVYGPGDRSNAYGPTKFLDDAARGRPVHLWGDGEELREFLFVDDLIHVMLALLFVPHAGPVNVVAGRPYSFLDVTAAIEDVLGTRMTVTRRPRTKAKVDNIFDAGLIQALCPDFVFTPLHDGIRKTFARQYPEGLARLEVQ